VAREDRHRSALADLAVLLADYLAVFLADYLAVFLADYPSFRHKLHCDNVLAFEDEPI
jgi:hypothetical protein